MTLQELIDQGEELKAEPYDSPDVLMWKGDLKEAVAPYGESALSVLASALWMRAVARPDHKQKEHQDRIERVITLLQNLQQKPRPQIIQPESIEQKTEQARESIGAKLSIGQLVMNGGSLSLGDNSPVTNVAVGELMLAVFSEAEKTLPDGKEKETILGHLKALTENETFASVAGASLSKILSGFLG